MSTGSKKKRRIDRVTSVELPPGVFGNLIAHLRRGHVLVRLAMCGVTAMLLWAITSGWTAHMPFHLGDVPQRDIVARTQFEREDQEQTNKAKDQARRVAVATYDNDPSGLEQIRAKLENDVTEIVAAKSLSDVD
jgi:membrane-associated HD superfamily phosphohydrolase